MAETTFKVKYDGPALEDGRMPVRELAPSLLSLGEIFRDASLLLYPDNDPVSLEIEATREGSFDVDLVLHAMGMGWDQISSLTAGEALASLVVFKDLVIGGKTDLSLFGLVKWLKGRRVEDEVDGPEPGQITLRVDGDSVVVQAEVATLNRSPAIRGSVRKVVEPLHREGVSVFEIHTDGEPVVELGKEDVPAFDLPDAGDEDVVSDEELELHLTVLQPSLEEDGSNKWKFGGLGETTFRAPIDDSEFMAKVVRHEEVFGVGDQIRGRLQIVQRRDPATGKIRTQHRVVKVHETVVAPKQRTLEEAAEGADDTV